MFAFKSRVLPSCLAVVSVSLAAAGCRRDTMNKPADPAASAAAISTEGLSKADMMAKGDDLMMKGQMKKDDAVKLEPGPAKDKLIQDGDEMMKKGQMMKDAAGKM